MKTPRGLEPLIEDGIIESVIRPLKSGKEASVYVVDCGNGVIRCAKVYKEAEKRGFHKLAEYQEGRRARGSRDQRAMGKRSKHGRKQQEEAWKNAEVDALYRLEAAGVRVPKPHGYFDGVLVMELVRDVDGGPAMRLNDVTPTADEARAWHGFLMNQIVRMLCAGLIHGDLSEFNVLLGPDGPVIIDLPQAVDAAGNNHAPRMLMRDVNNLRNFFGQHAPDLVATQYGPEIWSLYAAGLLVPDSPLTGRYERKQGEVDLSGVLREIEDARREEAERLLRMS